MQKSSKFLGFAFVFAATFAGVAGEGYVSRSVELRLGERGAESVSLSSLLDLANAGRVNSVIVIAASEGRSNAVAEILLDRHVLLSRRLGGFLEVIQVNLSEAEARSASSLSIRGSGALRVVSVGVTADDISSTPDPTPPSGEPYELKQMIHGASLSTRDAALQSHVEACDAFKREAQSLLRRRLRFVSCGEAKDIAPSGSYLFQSEGKILIDIVSPPETLEVVVGGLSHSDRAAALADFQARCAAFQRDMALNLRERFVWASCGEGKDVAPSGSYRFEAKVRVLGSFRVADLKTSTESIRGASASNIELARRSFEGRCEEWKQEMRARHGSRVVLLNCGAPKDIAPSGSYQFSSNTEARLLP